MDASIWVAVVDPRDRFHEPAKSIALEVDAPVAALDLTLYEIANAVGAKKRLFDEARFMTQLVLDRCQDRLVRVDPDLLDLACDCAASYDLTAYDAAYVAAAKRNRWTLVSADVADLVSKGLAVTPDAALYP
ncbi:MAG: PIN domain-containing protein [Solirubrobacterales bacterium]